MQLSVLYSESSPPQAESLLADRLGLPLFRESDLKNGQLQKEDKPQFALRYAAEGLCLIGLQEQSTGTLLVDLNGAQMRRRIRESLHSQALGKAIGVGKRRPLRILDGTAGFATDSFLLATAGHEVIALERSKLVHALVKDAFTRAGAGTERAPSAFQRLKYELLDFLEYSAPPGSFHVVYLDPMFPDEKRTAKSKKSMGFLQQLLPASSNDADLLNHALTLASMRVVVKRSRHSSFLGGAKPDIQFNGKSNRFDVYTGVKGTG